MVFSLKNHHFKKSIPPEGTFAPITRNSVIAMENKRPHIKGPNLPECRNIPKLARLGPLLASTGPTPTQAARPARQANVALLAK